MSLLLQSGVGRVRKDGDVDFRWRMTSTSKIKPTHRPVTLSPQHSLTQSAAAVSSDNELAINTRIVVWRWLSERIARRMNENNIQSYDQKMEIKSLSRRRSLRVDGRWMEDWRGTLEMCDHHQMAFNTMHHQDAL